MPTRIRPKTTPVIPPVTPNPDPTVPTPLPPIIPDVESGIAWPTGNVTTKSPISGQPYGIPWDRVGRWEGLFAQADLEFGIDTLDLAPLAVIEAEGNHYVTGKMTGTRSEVIVRGQDGSDHVPAIGMMQVKAQYHQWRVPNADAYTPIGDVRLAAALLKAGIKEHGSFERALTATYFTADDPNGTTQAEYVAAWKSLRKELEAAGNAPVVVTDPYLFMFGQDVQVDYAFGQDEGLDYYGDFVGHGIDRSTQHSGDDALVPFGTHILAPLAGVVDCIGTQGTPRWGQGCGAYTDTGALPPYDDNGRPNPVLGVGNITILLDSGHKMTLGHCRKAFVKPGDRVEAGQLVGTTGGQNGAHCHVEISVLRNGTFWLLPPRKTLTAALGGKVTDTRPRVMFVGASQAVPLDVPFRSVIIPTTQRNQRPGTHMTPDRVVVHETGNVNPGMGAAAHLRYLQQGAPDDNGRPQVLSYHFTVDQDEVIQMIPANEYSWHGGDGGGPCNTRGISIETCVQDKNAHSVKTRANLEKLVAALRLAFNISLVEQHATCCSRLANPAGCHTDCPHFIRADNYWATMLRSVEANMAGSVVTGPPIPTYANASPPPDWTGDDVKVGTVTFRALRRNYTANTDGVRVLQYANKDSSPVRSPLAKDEKVEGWYVVDGDDRQPWVVTKFGSRIPMEALRPSVGFVR